MGGFAQPPHTRGSWLCLVGPPCGPDTEGLRPGEEVPEAWGSGPPLLFFTVGWGLVSLSSAKTTKLTWVRDSVGPGDRPGRGCTPSWPGKGPFPQNSGAADGTVTPRAEAANASGPVTEQGGSVPVSPDHLPGSVSSPAVRADGGSPGRYLGVRPQALEEEAEGGGLGERSCFKAPL